MTIKQTNRTNMTSQKKSAKNANKLYRIAPLAIAIAGLMVVTPAQTEVPSSGDLDIYSSSNAADKSPTIMMIVEGSTFTNNSDLVSGVEIIGTPKPSTNLYPNSLPVYDRNYYFPVGSINKPENWAYTRLTRMKDAIYYLMDTPGALPDNYRVGIGRYSSSTLSVKEVGDSQTGSINVPAKALGPVSEANNPSSQRYKIKQFVADICSSPLARLCTGNAPMAAAYAEAGAYMMGTKTGKLTYEETSTANTAGTEATEAEVNALPYTRVLRKGSGNKWQYCPSSNRQQVRYDTPQGVRLRVECPENEVVTLADGTTETKTYWVDIDSNIIASENWAGTAGFDQDEPKESEINSLSEDNQKYDLLWYGTGNRPHGTYDTGDQKRISPVTKILTPYNFTVDSFQGKNPTEATPEGAEDSWEYLIDYNLIPNKRLVPVLRYRALRQKYVGYNNRDSSGSLTPTRIWQYCPQEKAQLVNYIYSSYRLMCKEEDWLDMAKYGSNGKVDDSATDSHLKTGNFKPEWNLEWYGGYFPLITRGGRPAGIDGINGRIVDNPDDRYFIVDGLLNPYDGWQYYYDTAYTQSDYPPLPPTLNTGYSVSGIRNSPPEVRNHQRYTYDKPSYSECSGEVQYDSSGQAPDGAQSVENAIIFFTAGWPYSNIARPLNEMNMSLTAPATSNTLDPVSGAMTENSCLASGLSESSSGADSTINAANNHWGCIGEYSKRLRLGEKIDGSGNYDNPAGVPIKTGVFMFAANREVMPSIGTDESGLPKYNCGSTTNISQRNACLLGQYGAGYGEGGFFQSTSTNAEDSYQQLSTAFVKMAENLTSDVGLVPTSMPIAPANSFVPGKLLPSGYMPFISPRSGSRQAQWQGNLRKYAQAENGFVDQDTLSPFGSAANAILSVKTRDLWAKQSSRYRSTEQAGGAYSQIPMPTVNTTVTPRNVYLSKDSSGDLTRYSPSNIENASVTGIDASKQDTVRNLLLNYMGYTIENYKSTGIDKTEASDISATFSSGSNKSLGGVYHSTPTALIPKVTRDTDDNYSDYKTFIMFGAMDNALHIVHDKTGVEVMSYFPQEVLATNGQYKAITPLMQADVDEASPSFGVDGPWETYATYDFKDATEDEIIAKELYAFGGARLGAKAYYGIDLTGLENVTTTKGTDSINASTSLNGFQPKQLFTINNTTAGFERLGYTWAKPVITNISWKGDRKLVAILSGGYDATEYDKPDAVRKDVTSNSATLGNAIYVVDAKTGELLITATGGSASTSGTGFVDSDASGKAIVVKNPNLKYSVPSSVKVLDRDADELTDHVYFADLDGQIFRMDLDNISSINKKVAKARLVRLADLDSNQTDKKHGPRLYETPAVTIQEQNGKRFATVSVASGDRSNPLRVANPATETASISVTYTNISGDLRTVKAARRPTTETGTNYEWTKVSGFPEDNTVTLAEGVITVDDSVRTKGTKVTATTTFLTTDTVTSTLDTVSGMATTSTNADPYAPKIAVAADGKLTVTPSISAGTNTPDANYVYTIYDKDVASPNFYNTAVANLVTKDVTITASNIPDVTSTNTSNYSKAGWRVPLLRFGDSSDASEYQTDNKTIKALGPLSAIANRLYVTAYNPNDGKVDATGCTAQVVGATEVYQFCLPYGICDTSYTDQYQRTKYGKGIMPLAWASDTNGVDRKLFNQNSLTTTTGADGAESSVTNSNNPDLNNNAPTSDEVFEINDLLKPLDWFDYSAVAPK